MPTKKKSPAQEKAGAPKPCDLIVRNGYVITVDANRTLIPDGAIAVKKGEIVGVGYEKDIRARFKAAETIDAKGGAVHPGFIEPHVHASLHSTRGTFPDGAKASSPFRQWYGATSPEDEYASGMHCALEALKNGFTGFVDPGSAVEPDAIADAATEVGVRSWVAEPFLWDLPPPGPQVKQAPASLERALGLLGNQLFRNKKKNALARGHVALYGLGSQTDELLLAAKKKADEAGVTLTLHQSFAGSDTAGDDKRFGKHPLVHFAEIGALGRNCMLVHMNIIRDDEFKPIIESGLSIAWHPGNFQFYTINKETPSRMAELWDRGTNITLCTDVAKAWTFGDMGLVAYLVAREYGGYVSAEGLFEMQSIRAARAIGADATLGSLEVGKRADIVIRTPSIGEAQPNLDPIREIALIGRSKSVDTVIVDGRIALRKGRAVHVDEERVWKLAGKSARKVAASLGLTVGPAWKPMPRSA